MCIYFTCRRASQTLAVLWPAEPNRVVLLQVGRAFLEPYGLNGDAGTFTAEATSGPVHQALQGLNPAAVQVYRYRPYSPAGSTPGDANGTKPSNTR
jgi:hypothetical protein